jgi:putative ABC transport system permease protein
MVTREQFQTIKVKPGLAKLSDGTPLASLEMITVITLDSEENPQGMNINLRGMLPVGFAMREGVRLAEGRMFSPGRREVVVGQSISARYPAARLGGTIEFGRGAWTVVGILDGGSTAFNSEIFADLNLVSADYDRSQALSSALLRTEPGQMEALKKSLLDDRQLNIDVTPERDYYAQQTQSALPVQFMGTLVAVIMAVGSGLAAMNTMYAAVARRSGEIATLRVLGFSRFAILTSFFLEALLLASAGGLVGLLLVLPLDGSTTAMGSFTTFTEVAFRFRISPDVAAAGFVFALVIGGIGGLMPAVSAARKEILTGLRAV